jgi:hypothetical protein
MDSMEVMPAQDDEPVRQIAAAMSRVRQLLEQHKPNDRSPEDRAYAVTLTDLEKVRAYFVVYVGGYHS